MLAATRATRTKRFQKTIVEWFAANVTLIAFSGHTTDAPRIVFHKTEDQPTDPSVPLVTVSIIHFGLIETDAQQGPFRTQVVVNAWSADALATADAMDAAYIHAEAVNGIDVEVHAHSIRTSAIVPLAPVRVQEPGDDDESGIYVSTAVFLITWRDEATS